MELAFENRTVAITGAGAGIGRATALALATEGAQLVLGGRDPAHLDATAEAVRELGASAATVAADLESDDGLAALAEAAQTNLDGLVCCVGSTPIGHFDAIGDDAWERAFAGKLRSTARAVRAMLPLLREHDGGGVVIVAGNAARTVPPEMVTSSVINGGLERLAVALARDNGTFGVSVNCVSPGPTRTARYDQLLAAGPETSADDAAVRITSRIADGRPAEPEEVAALITFLLSPLARHVTGETIAIDGAER